MMGKDWSDFYHDGLAEKVPSENGAGGAGGKKESPAHRYPETAFCVEKITEALLFLAIASAVIVVLNGLTAFPELTKMLFITVLGLILFGASAASIYGYINILIGLNRGKNEFKGYLFALGAVAVYIADLVMRIVLQIDDSILSQIFDLIPIAVMFLTVSATITVCGAINHEELAEFGRRTRRIWLITAVVRVVLTAGMIAVKASAGSESADWPDNVTAVLAALVSTIGFFILYRFFKRTDDVFKDE